MEQPDTTGQDTVERTDVAIVGAGPAGLWAMFEAGVIGLDCVTIDALDRAGGQCTELYPDKPIYDIPAVPRCSAQELVDRLLEQCAPFGFPIYLGERAETLARSGERWRLTTSAGRTIDAAAVLIAAGNGAFVPQRVALPEAERFEGNGLHYAVREAERFKGRRVLIAGGGDSALDWALALRGVAAHVTLLHRRVAYRAAPATANAVMAAHAAGQIDLVTGTLEALHESHGALRGARVKTLDGVRELEFDDLIALFGLVPDLGPLANWDVDARAGRIPVDACRYETALPGVFAIGDIALYDNKQKLILSAFHESSLALRKAFAYARPDTQRTHVHSSYDSALKQKLETGTYRVY
ncbi:NAD(P)/FAD-dependent oxidoreductase [Pararobbsia silviterrae]|uniref:Ferredoxin--NADP reductase n=1 Tax=Pararobbsia silviterrae TaxID=1792498 RepID=A0A494XDK5_9BURK|nr:NAD(P)/FAD-dependent oxidoreductase [Pararobbsia silviterrae]RKP47751.1 NAD(P)/FAD-dependent oxidoreductase [Pararobbsia silviterrae]